jgi:SAM-dependent methyltransferase
MKKYDKNYFETNNYKNYLDRKDRYFKTAEELYQTLNRIGLLNKNTKILDYGCAVGFLIKGLENIGLKNVYGYDISDWASKQAIKNNCKLINKLKGNFQMGIFLDVLEHMNDSEILKVFKTISFDRIIVRIPCSIESKPNDFFLEISRLDKTHINCKTQKQWVNFFKKLGYNKHFELNMSTIYNSDGCFCSIFIK